MKIVFLDIDGVLQPTWSINRFVDGHFVHVRHELDAKDCEFAQKLLLQENGPYLLPQEIFV